MLVGGMIVSRYDLDVRGIIKVNIAASIVALMCCAILFKSCPDTGMCVCACVRAGVRACVRQCGQSVALFRSVVRV